MATRSSNFLHHLHPAEAKHIGNHVQRITPLSPVLYNKFQSSSPPGESQFHKLCYIIHVLCVFNKDFHRLESLCIHWRSQLIHANQPNDIWWNLPKSTLYVLAEFELKKKSDRVPKLASNQHEIISTVSTWHKILFHRSWMIYNMVCIYVTVVSLGVYVA